MLKERLYALVKLALASVDPLHAALSAGEVPDPNHAFLSAGKTPVRGPNPAPPKYTDPSKAIGGVSLVPRAMAAPATLATAAPAALAKLPTAAANANAAGDVFNRAMNWVGKTPHLRPGRLALYGAGAYGLHRMLSGPKKESPQY